MSDQIGPYRIIRQLGSGGMGDVFLADDPRLGRQVALKRPSGEWLKSQDAVARLLREARAAGQLNHPNIAAVHDVLDLDGRLHIVMEYAPGESLAVLVSRGALPPDRVLDIGLQLAAALCEAHAHGVIHRDLKPANVVILPSGQVKVLDFGVAKVAMAGSAATEPGTEAGRVFGTPGYMAPEQIVGLPADARSDIYSVGLLLFELLTGRRPFDDPTGLGRALASLQQRDGPRPDAVNAAVPAPLADIVARALARDPDQRFQGADDLRAALTALSTAAAASGTAAPIVPSAPARRWIAGLLAAVAVVVLGMTVVRPWLASRGAALPPGTPVVAVLPFANLSGDASDEFLAVGFADSLITDLATVPDLIVVRREDLRDLSATSDPRTVAKRVGATLIVKPSLQRAGNDLRVNVELVRADAAHVWSDKYEGTTDKIFDLQRRVADGVMAGGALGVVARTGTVLRSSDVAAVISYGQGRAKLDRSDVAGNVEEAMTLLTAATARDPTFALAHAALGEAAVKRYALTKDRQWVDVALQETAEAVKLDPALADGYVSQALAYRQTGQTAQAIAALETAITLQRNHDNAHEVLGEVLFAAGSRDRAIDELKEAIRLRPIARHYDRLGVAYLRMARYDEGIVQLRRAADLQPDNATIRHRIGTAYQLTGDFAHALEFYTQAIQIQPLSETYVNMGVIQYDQHDYQGSARSFAEAVTMRPNEPQTHRNLADALRKTGATAQAAKEYAISLDLLDKALAVNTMSAALMGQRAVCLAKLNRLPEALRQVADPAVRNSQEGEVLYRRAVVMAMAGRDAEALEALDVALAHGYSAKAAEHDDDLDRLRTLPAFHAKLQKYQK